MSAHGSWGDTRAGSDDAAHPSPHRARVGLGTIAFGLLAAPAAWALQLLVNAGLAEWACYPHDERLAQPAWASLHALLLGFDAATLACAILGAAVAWRAWRRTRGERPGTAHALVASGDGRTRFMAMAGIMVSALFALAIVFATLNLRVTGCG